eukprot:CAMPEP_0201572460 /NCGR_PEP_ID=MMETSP0190_2-20130828/15724_1 /ASSEMBLY_ACC=CAM_ASM_000263 /TAXON_ID=37353 /ORGANISM="Rosalina sp." /LENGTH=370 /DNA_ID=CAMNT_0047998225 /DNA_START=32 /DNA_END=1141 /DNA_ORIENTATION=+
MGCCSSSNSVAHSSSPTRAPGDANDNSPPHMVMQNTERVNPQSLQQHHNINQGQNMQIHNDTFKKDDITISGSFANNQSIMKEVMRLEQYDEDNEEQPKNPQQPNYNQETYDINRGHEIKSNEHSEDIAIPSNQQSFAEFSMNTINVQNDNDNNYESPSFDRHHHQQYNDNNMSPDSYHPFGIRMQNQQQNLENMQYQYNTHEIQQEPEERSIVEDLQALYAENLKQQGFDADKFRNANLSKNDTMNGKQGMSDRRGSNDMSSFASSQLSSKSEEINTRKVIQNYGNNYSDEMLEEQRIESDIDMHNDDYDDGYNEYDDLMYKELSRPASMMYGMKDNDIQEASIQESVKQGDNGQVSNIMDDEDEELMD